MLLHSASAVQRCTSTAAAAGVLCELEHCGEQGPALQLPANERKQI
jgi:hypothetical protein